ncbi:MAG: hypothetical protein JWR50_718 [Mucilaginibacter sp.]|nr:hypothetical protein [Mucilaginibacter sp.]
MKKIIILSIISSTVFCLLSCKKNKTTPADSTVEIEYQISPLDPIHHNWIDLVTYTDKRDSSVTATDLSAFQNGVLNFTVSKKPFNASIGITNKNLSSEEVDYLITISVNGAIKATNPVQVKPATQSFASCHYTVQ